MTTLIFHVPALRHTKLYHPENRARLAEILPALEHLGLLDSLALVEPIPATNDQLRHVHTQGLIDYVKMMSAQGGGILDGGDTYATEESYKQAKLAAGSCCLAVDHIMKGRAKNGFALVRPPGHHAEIDHVGGFCLFNNIAVAARHAQVKYGVQRVFILDFDVHHGNGTQDIFFEDNSVLFASMHLFAPFFYPGIGGIHEIGTRNGKGYTANIPLPPGVGDIGYMRALQEYISPRIRNFQPQIILISIGFDAHWGDPLAMASLSLTGYAIFVQTLVNLANSVCNGRILFVLEGGYQLDVLTFGIANTFAALLGRDTIWDPIGPSPEPEQDISPLLDNLKSRDLQN